MESERKGVISIVTGDADVGLLYDAILRSGGFTPRLSTYKDKGFQVALNPLPHLIVLHLDMRFFADILEFLQRMHQSHYEQKRPMILLVAHKDWSDPRFEPLVDIRLTSPVDPHEFLRVVEDLLHKRSYR